MKRIVTTLISATFALAVTPLIAPAVHADTLHVKESLQAKVRQEQHMNLPRRGMTMAQVEREYGAPLRKLQTRGGDTPRHPPINRWEYAKYIVYFERNHVIHSVLRTPGPDAL